MTDTQLANEVYKKLYAIDRPFDRLVLDSNRKNYEAVKKISESPFIEYIVGEKNYADPEKRAATLAEKLRGHVGTNYGETLAATGKTPWKYPHYASLIGTEKSKLQKSYWEFAKTKNTFEKQANALTGELAAEQIIGEAGNMKELSDKLAKFGEEFNEARQLYKSSDSFAAAKEYFRMEPVKAALANKVKALKQEGIPKAVVKELTKALGATPRDAKHFTLIGDIALPVRSGRVEKIGQEISGLIAEYSPKLDELAQKANNLQQELLNKGRRIPVGELSARPAIDELVRRVGTITKAESGIAAAAAAAAGMLEKGGKEAMKTVEGAKKSGMFSWLKGSKTAQTAEAAVESVNAGAEALAEGGSTTKRTWLATATSPKYASDGVTEIKTFKQAKEAGELSKTRIGLTVAATLLGASYLMGIGPFARREDPQYKRIAAAPEQGAAHRA